MCFASAALANEATSLSCGGLPIPGSQNKQVNFWDTKLKGSKLTVAINSPTKIFRSGDLLIFREDAKFNNVNDPIEKVYNVLVNGSSHLAFVLLDKETKEIKLIESPQISIAKALAEDLHLDDEEKMFPLNDSEIKSKILTIKTQKFANDKEEKLIDEAWIKAEDINHTKILQYRKSLTGLERDRFYKKMIKRIRDHKLKGRHYDIYRIRKDYPNRKNIMKKLVENLDKMQDVEFEYDLFGNELYRTSNSGCEAKEKICEERLVELRAVYSSKDIGLKHCTEIITDIMALSGIDVAFENLPWISLTSNFRNLMRAEESDPAKGEKAYYNGVTHLIDFLTEDLRGNIQATVLKGFLRTFFFIYSRLPDKAANWLAGRTEKVFNKRYGRLITPEDLRVNIFERGSKSVLSYVGTSNDYRCKIKDSMSPIYGAL